MRRDIAIDCLHTVLDDIHNNVAIQTIKQKCQELKEKVDWYDLQIEKPEIYKERLAEYIKFFNIIGISENEIFERTEDFYELLKENLKEEWPRIEERISSGKNLIGYI